MYASNSFILVCGRAGMMFQAVLGAFLEFETAKIEN